MKLGDLVWRSALRKRQARDAEVAPYVFEVTDLTIPAGTLWRAETHRLASVTLDEAQAIHWAFYLEIGAPLPAGHQLRLDLGDNANSHDSIDLVSCAIAPGAMVALVSTSDAIQILHDAAGQSAVSFIADLHLVVEGNGNDVPTSAPITIVRARAAFLVI